MREAFGLIWTPAPTSPNADACSYTCTSNPASSNDKAAPRPPMPAPMMPTETPTAAPVLDSMPGAGSWPREREFGE
jgi:hypothetical protein